MGLIMKQERSLEKPSTHFWRAAAAVVRGFVEQSTAEQALKRRHPDDVVAPIILRGATGPATTTDPAWAAPLAQLSVSEAIEDIVAMTVVGRLSRSGALKIDLGRYAAVRVPGRAVHPGDAGVWVQEGHPIPTRQFQLLTGAVLTPQKLACIVPLTREITVASYIEAVVKALLIEAAGISLDAALFSASAGTPAQPAGLLNGLTALTPSASTGFEACGDDLGTLVEDIANRGGGAHAFFVTAPKQAVTARFYAGGQFYISPGDDVLPIAGSAGLPSGTVIAIEPQSLAYSIDTPQFEISNAAAIHLEDTTPKDIVAGTPATPVKSMFQTDSIALRMMLWATWGMRAPHVSFMQGVAW